ncbi:hypothetical protein PNOK_0404400 [Pyrrhoderma noxium]|uniref:C3H1-type domain-containing protein n=1 Tax=Pyrrhoderma noxium TaxID=2282107 RepID=A0A286UP92_9AGAM|nr:hypothetical protein PNOK_0404400 [Pyrrhoderma noxium]
MTICAYFLQGRCRFGSTCKNEHPVTRPGSVNVSNAGVLIVPFSQEGLAKDITPGFEKPLWPFSSFGPAKFESTIIAGLDISPEELRFKALEALRSGNPVEYEKFESEKTIEANQTYSKALGEIEQIYKHAYDLSVAMQKKLPMPRNPVYNSPTNTASPAFRSPGPVSAFGTTAQPSAFGTPGPVVSAFAKPAFGQPAFGQPSFGQSAFAQASKPVSAFGQPGPVVSAFAPVNNQTSSAFGQPAQTSAFGQASQPQSSFIRPASGAFANAGGGGGGFSAFAGSGNSAFGAGAQQNANPVFGQPSAFGANAANTANNNNNNTAQTSAFGLPAKPVSAFGQPAFGQQQQTQPVFGQPSQPVSAFAQAAKGNPVFGQPSQPVSAFGQPVVQPVSAFGQPAQPVSAFGQPTQPVSAFAQPTQPVSAFTQPPAFGNPGQGFAGLPQKPKPSSPDFTSALSSVKAIPMLDKHDGLLPKDYANQLPADVREIFAAEKFEWGKIPEWLPPIEMR